MYFDLDYVCNKHNIDYKKGNCIICIIGPRNIGKTTNPLNVVLTNCDKNNEKCALGRISEKQLKENFVPDFNQRFVNQYKTVNKNIYKIIPYDKKNAETNQIETYYKTGKHIGYTFDLNNQHNYKSVEAKDIKWILIDEIIQIETIPHFYKKLINTLKTFSRFNRPTIILIGNRDTANNELMVKWKIKPILKADKKDRVIRVRDPSGVDTNIYYIDLGEEDYQDLKDKYDDTDIVDQAAKLDKETDLYINFGGYLEKLSLNVIPAEEIINNGFDAKFIVSFKEQSYVLGVFDDDTKIALISDYDVLEVANNELANIAIDNISTLMNTTTINKNKTRDKIIKWLGYHFKENSLYFDSFSGLTEMKKLMEKIKWFDK